MLASGAFAFVHPCRIEICTGVRFSAAVVEIALCAIASSLPRAAAPTSRPSGLSAENESSRAKRHRCSACAGCPAFTQRWLEREAPAGGGGERVEAKRHEGLLLAASHSSRCEGGPQAKAGRLVSAEAARTGRPNACSEHASYRRRWCPNLPGASHVWRQDERPRRQGAALERPLAQERRCTQ